MGPYHPFVGPWPIPRLTDVFFAKQFLGWVGGAGISKLFFSWTKYIYYLKMDGWKTSFLLGRFIFWDGDQNHCFAQGQQNNIWEWKSCGISFAFLPSCLFPKPLRSNGSYLALWMLTCNLLPGQLSWRHPKNWFMRIFCSKITFHKLGG